MIPSDEWCASLPLHQNQGRLLGHDIVNDTLDALLVLIQDLGADSTLDRGLDLSVSSHVFLDVEPIGEGGEDK